MNWSEGRMAEQQPILISIYRSLARALTPLFHVLFWLRCRSGKEIPGRKNERFGRGGATRPDGKLIWIHAASVGETMSVLPLIEALSRDGKKVLLTTVTVTAAELAQSRLPEGSIHQFVPFDAPGPVARFLDHWNPDLVMVVESEVWPCLFVEMRARSTPFVLLNGRLSDSSHKSWSRLPRVSGYIFNCLDLVLAQSTADAARFRKLGCLRVETPGNLKFDAEEPMADTADLVALKEQIGARHVWLAALTHPGEEEITLQAFTLLQQEFPDLLLVLVPRHPARADEIRDLVEQQGLSISLRSDSGFIDGHTQVYLGDTLGEMGLYYRLAPVTFLGGSFNDAGGHNPVEAALVGSALVTGPNVSNARAVYKDVWIAGASVRVREPENLAAAVGKLLGAPEEALRQSHEARALVEAGRGALQNTLTLLTPYLTVETEDRLREAAHE
jgi:3-deoxy-D-manno-octulosonic-acid transferase